MLIGARLLVEAMNGSGTSCFGTRGDGLTVGGPMKDAGEREGEPAEVTDTLERCIEKVPLSTDSSSDPNSSNLKYIPVVEDLCR